MRAFITGISGFVGPHLVRDLLGESLEVHGIIERESSRFLFDKEPKRKVFLYPCDICDSDRLTRILREVSPDQVFHLAGVSYLPQANLEAERTFQINLLGTLNLYEAVRRCNLKPRILFVGSAQEYGLTFHERNPVKEDYSLRPIDSYSSSKAAADLLSFQYWYGSGLSIIRVRPFNHTGPGQSERFVCSALAKQIAEVELGRRKPILHVGNLEARRDFLDVRDVVRAYRLALQGGEVGEVYNICSERSVSIREVLKYLLDLSQQPVSVVEEASRKRPLEIPEMLGDCARFRAATGWQRQIPLEQTLKDLLNHWRSVISQGGERVDV
jgi:GDP-4-dehydro-6-deoxy-D-mannose reductase